MQFPKFDICGVAITALSISQINKLIITHAKRSKAQPLVIFKPYVEFLARANKDDSIRILLNQANYTIADATSVQWAGSYLYGNPNIHTNLFSTFWSLAVRLQSKRWRDQVFPQKMSGVDMTKPLLKLAEKSNLTVGILGGPKNTPATQENLQKIFPKLNFRVWNGYFTSKQEPAVVSEIARYQPDILLVAMGFPRQEIFINTYKDKLGAKVLIGEGGSFDYDQLGGSIKRAPNWLRSIGMEWLWRLFKQPKRAKRQSVIPGFILAIRTQKITQK